jgi:protein-disulfide isomerase
MRLVPTLNFLSPRTSLAVLAALSLVACSSESNRAPEFAAPAPAAPLPGPSNAAPLETLAGEPEELPGVDTTELVRRERHTWWQLVSQLYAPCADQAVSLAQCVREARPCAACLPAARLLAGKILGGATAAQAQSAYGVRFGPSVKTIELADSPARGPAAASVQIVVWSDFECPACARAMPLIDAVVERFPAEVRLIHKVYPLKVHKHADQAARAGVAAHLQERYWEMERLLFGHQTRLEDADLLGYAKQLGLDMKRFQADMAGERAARIIERDRAEADRAGIQGTPFIVINGREFDLGLFSLQGELESWVATEIALKGKAEPKPVAGGAPAVTGSP